MEITSIANGGDGVAALDGMIVFVPGTCAGDTVRARMTGRGKGWLKATCVEVLAESPSRAEPECPLYFSCGGCSLQHVSYEAQLSCKKDIVVKAFRNVPGMESTDPAIHGTEPYGSRCRMRFSFAPSGAIGFFGPSSHDVVPVPCCPVAVQSVNVFLAGDDARKPCRSAFPRLKDTKDGVLAFGTDDRLWLEGHDTEVRVNVLGKAISFPVSGFFQTNLTLLPELVDRVTDGLDGKSVCDFYAGVGLFAAFAANGAREITCVEEFRPAAEYARKNVAHDRLKVWPASVETWIKETGRTRFDTVIVDPPRTGLSPVVVKYLLESKPDEIRYVSCDPLTLARDVALLERGGYAPDSLELFDFYPQTTHVESYLVLRKRS